MSDNEIHKNDVGTVFVATIMDAAAVINISTATTKQLLFRKPNGTVLTKAGAFTTDGSDGKLQYTTIAGDLSDVGGWSLQAKLIFPAGTWYSDVHRFEVHKNVM